MSLPRAVVITGCNRGLGRALVRLLCEKNSSAKIVMTARDPSKGNEAFSSLKSQYPKADLLYHNLDVSKSESIKEFMGWYRRTVPYLDILVNNAVTALDQWSKSLASVKTMQETLDTNFYGLMELTENLHPFLNNDGKIINISAMMALLNNHGPRVKELLTDATLNKEKLLTIAEEYKKGVHDKNLKDWNKSAYVVSKTLVNAYTRIIARDLVRNDQMAMSMCPGWCKTDLGGAKAPGKEEDGAKKMYHLMFDVPFKRDEKINGKFFMNNKVVNP